MYKKLEKTGKSGKYRVGDIVKSPDGVYLLFGVSDILLSEDLVGVDANGHVRLDVLSDSDGDDENVKVVDHVDLGRVYEVIAGCS